MSKGAAHGQPLWEGRPWELCRAHREDDINEAMEVITNVMNVWAMVSRCPHAEPYAMPQRAACDAAMLQSHSQNPHDV